MRVLTPVMVWPPVCLLQRACSNMSPFPSVFFLCVHRQVTVEGRYRGVLCPYLTDLGTNRPPETKTHIHQAMSSA